MLKYVLEIEWNFVFAEYEWVLYSYKGDWYTDKSEVSRGNLDWALRTAKYLKIDTPELKHEQ